MQKTQKHGSLKSKFDYTLNESVNEKTCMQCESTYIYAMAFLEINRAVELKG